MRRPRSPAWDFNPPSPWGEGLTALKRSVRRTLFQSTLPVGGGTAVFLAQNSDKLVISIHPPRGGRDDKIQRPQGGMMISIHPPRGGRDGVGFPATVPRIISIHPPRGGRDPASA